MRFIRLFPLALAALLLLPFPSGPVRGGEPGLANPVVVHGPGGALLPASAFPGALPQFAEVYVGNRTSGEPRLAFDETGATYYGGFAPGSTFAETFADGGNRGNVSRTGDGGATWTNVTPQVLGRNWPLTDWPAGLNQYVGPSDPYLTWDPTTGRVFDLALTAGCLSMSWTSDHGATWNPRPLVCASPTTVEDHPTLAVGPATVLPTIGYPSVLYVCENALTHVSCAHSLDGGITWLWSGTAGLPCTSDIETLNTSTATGYGYGLTGPLWAARDGTTYLGYGRCGESWIAITRDNGAHFETSVVDASVGREDQTVHFPSAHDSIVTTDDAGNVYYFFLDRFHMPRLSVSRDQGRSWSAPLAVAAPGITAAKFPAITAGADGRVAFLYLGSTVPGGFDANATENATATWNAYVGVTLDALDASPVFATTTINAPADPILRGPCDGRCSVAQSWSFFDYFDLQLNPTTDKVWASIVDLCNGACSTARPGESYPASDRAAVGIEVGGTPLR
ncbi:MAG: sialidase family protein [Thermoplasmatota archaeon]